MKQIRSRDNPQFRTLLKLARSAKERQSCAMMLLDGDHLVEAARDAGMVMVLLAIGESALHKPVKRRLFESVRAETRLALPDSLLGMISPVCTASGLVALARIPQASEFSMSSPACLMLDGIQDPGNLGTILRTAAAAGIRDVALSEGSASVWSPKVLRAGMGAHFRLRLHERADLLALATRYEGTTVATRPDACASVYETDLSGPVAWLFGNEGAGLSPELAQCAHATIGIPMPGQSDSLNVASAVAICLFEQIRQQHAKS